MQKRRQAGLKAEELHSKAVGRHNRLLQLTAFQTLVHHRHCQLVMHYIMGLTLLRLASTAFSAWRLLTERELSAKDFFCQRTTGSVLRALKAWRYGAAVTMGPGYFVTSNAMSSTLFR